MNLTQSLGLLFGKGTGLFHTVKLENDNLQVHVLDVRYLSLLNYIIHVSQRHVCISKFARTNATPWSLQEISGSTWRCDCHLLVKEALSFLQI